MSPEIENGSPEEKHGKVTNLNTERVNRELDKLQERWSFLSNQVDKNNEVIERLNLQVDNISNPTKREMLAKELYDLEDQTMKHLMEMMEIEDRMKEILS